MGCCEPSRGVQSFIRNPYFGILKITVLKFDISPQYRSSASAARVSLNMASQSHTSRQYQLGGGLQFPSTFDFIINATYQKERALAVEVVESKERQLLGSTIFELNQKLQSEQPSETTVDLNHRGSKIGSIKFRFEFDKIQPIKVIVNYEGIMIPSAKGGKAKAEVNTSIGQETLSTNPLEGMEDERLYWKGEKHVFFLIPNHTNTAILDIFNNSNPIIQLTIDLTEIFESIDHRRTYEQEFQNAETYNGGIRLHIQRYYQQVIGSKPQPKHLEEKREIKEDFKQREADRKEPRN